MGIGIPFLVSIASQYRQVGNAVPVKLSSAVAQSIRNVLLYEYEEQHPEEEVSV